MARSWVSASRSNRQVPTSTSRVTARLLLRCRGRVLARTASRSAERRLGERNGTSCPLFRQDGRERIELQRPPAFGVGDQRAGGDVVHPRRSVRNRKCDPPSAAARRRPGREAARAGLPCLARPPGRRRDRPVAVGHQEEPPKGKADLAAHRLDAVHQQMDRGILAS